MISFLSKYQSPTAAALFSEHQILSEESRRLKNEYSPLHSLAVKNREDISALGTKVNSARIELTGEFRRKVAQNDERIQKLNSQLAALPSKELHLSNLQRRYDVASTIYAELLPDTMRHSLHRRLRLVMCMLGSCCNTRTDIKFQDDPWLTVVGLFLALSLVLALFCYRIILIVQPEQSGIFAILQTFTFWNLYRSREAGSSGGVHQRRLQRSLWHPISPSVSPMRRTGHSVQKFFLDLRRSDRSGSW